MRVGHNERREDTGPGVDFTAENWVRFASLARPFGVQRVARAPEQLSRYTNIDCKSPNSRRAQNRRARVP